MDLQPLLLGLDAAILLGGAFSFLIVGPRYPSMIKQSLRLYALANVAVAAGGLVEVFFKPTAPALSQASDLGLAGIGTCLYYLAYRSLQERTYHLRMVVALYALLIVAIASAYAVLANANLAIFALCMVDVVLFGLAARDLLMNFGGRGRAHLIQGIGLTVFTLLIGAWGISFLFVPPAPVIVIGNGDGLSSGIVGNCFAAAFGAMNFLLICNDEFNARLVTLAATDPLTGVANRRKLMERGKEEFSRARRHNDPLTVIMIDLDHFKRLNDAHGHAAGDLALREAARAWGAALRDIDLLSRSGGEEFAVLLPKTPLARGLEVAERLRHAVAAIDFPWGTEKNPLTASLGVAQMSPHDTAIDQVIARADRALYRSKDEGRNRVTGEAADDRVAVTVPV